MTFRFTVLLVALAALLSPGLSAQARRQRFELPSQVLRESREIWVWLPQGYGESTQGFPVLFLLDGEAGERMASIVDSVVSEGGAPEMIVVAVPNTHRVRDLSPVRVPDRPESGGAGAFLEFFRTELIPAVEERFRTGRGRILYGHSLGGLFAVYALFSDPPLFGGYIASSPPLDWGDWCVRERAGEAFGRSGSWSSTLLLSVGSGELARFVDSSREFAAWLSANAPGDFNWSRVVLEGEDHGSSGWVALRLGLERLFAGGFPR